MRWLGRPHSAVTEETEGALQPGAAITSNAPARSTRAAERNARGISPSSGRARVELLFGAHRVGNAERGAVLHHHLGSSRSLGRELPGPHKISDFNWLHNAHGVH